MAKKTGTITLYVSELIYDIRNKAYLTGKSRKNGENHEEVANMQASEDEEDENQILRSIQSATGELRNFMSEYMSETSENDDNIWLDKTKNKTITFTINMPSNYNQATMKTISSAAHDYVVNKSVSDWLLITDKNDAGDYLSKANVNAATIREALSKRVCPSRTAPTAAS